MLKSTAGTGNRSGGFLLEHRKKLNLACSTRRVSGNLT
jgi:hypothetical protein